MPSYRGRPKDVGKGWRGVELCDCWFIVQKVRRTATPSIGSKCLAGPAAANPARAERAEVSQHHKEAEQGRALGSKV